jgi:hypothetical protein
MAAQPKKETDIHPSVMGLLSYIELAKNLEITREFPIGGGQLDFLISGRLTSGEAAYACMEVKHAHSRHILNGLLTQLPAYMKAKESDYGLYCIMWFKGIDFNRPAKFATISDLEFYLVTGLLKAKLPGKIKIVIVNVSHQLSPSKQD